MTIDLRFGPISEARRLAISRAKKGIPLSLKDRARVKKQFAALNKIQVGELHPRWKGKFLTYTGIHKWLERQYGKASACLNLDCSKRSKVYQWAKKRRCKYYRLRDNFTMLCASCHQKYDKNSDFKIRLRDLLTKNRTMTEETIRVRLPE